MARPKTQVTVTINLDFKVDNRIDDPRIHGAVDFFLHLIQSMLATQIDEFSSRLNQAMKKEVARVIEAGGVREAEGFHVDVGPEPDGNGIRIKEDWF